MYLRHILCVRVCMCVVNIAINVVLERNHMCSTRRQFDYPSDNSQPVNVVHVDFL